MKYLLFLIGLTSYGQDIQTILNAIHLARFPPTVALTVTASQGDGSVLTFGKVPGSSIYLTLSASSPGGTTKTAIFIPAAAQTTTQLVWGSGDALCLLLANTTTNVIAVTGSWVAIPPNNVAYQCSTQITSNGVVTGQTPLVAGVIAWP